MTFEIQSHYIRRMTDDKDGIIIMTGKTSKKKQSFIFDFLRVIHEERR